jgi:hypothetical protein
MALSFHCLAHRLRGFWQTDPHQLVIAKQWGRLSTIDYLRHLLRTIDCQCSHHVLIMALVLRCVLQPFWYGCRG